MTIKGDGITAEVTQHNGAWRVSVNGKGADFSTYSFHTAESALLAMCSLISPSLLIQVKGLIAEN